MLKYGLHFFTWVCEYTWWLGANAEDDPLRWVEENIPATADNENPLPVLDSEEEIETTRFELSKMQ